MSQIQEQLEGLPGYDILMDYWNDYAGEHFNSIDPFQDEDGNKRKLPKEYSSSQEQKLWKKVQSQAWTHDRCFLGSCGIGLDCGFGLVPFVCLFFPVLGPIIMYGVHSRLISIVTNEMKLPNKMVAKMQGQILFDLIITLPPVIGSFFGYLHGCSTRNAGMIYKYFLFLGEQRKKNNAPTYIGRGAIGQGNEMARSHYQVRENNYSNPQPKKTKFNKQSTQNEIQIGNQQQSGFV